MTRPLPGKYLQGKIEKFIREYLEDNGYFVRKVQFRTDIPDDTSFMDKLFQIHVQATTDQKYKQYTHDSQKPEPKEDRLSQEIPETSL